MSFPLAQFVWTFLLLLPLQMHTPSFMNDRPSLPIIWCRQNNCTNLSSVSGKWVGVWNLDNCRLLAFIALAVCPQKHLLLVTPSRLLLLPLPSLAHRWLLKRSHFCLIHLAHTAANYFLLFIQCAGVFHKQLNAIYCRPPALLLPVPLPTTFLPSVLPHFPEIDQLTKLHLHSQTHNNYFHTNALQI